MIWQFTFNDQPTKHYPISYVMYIFPYSLYLDTLISSLEEETHFFIQTTKENISKILIMLS